MQTEITTIYVICDDYLKTRNYCDDSQVSLTTAGSSPGCHNGCTEH